MKYSIFVPCYNEEKILKSNVLRIKKALEVFTKDYELFIVDDSSRDKTPLIGKELARKYKSIKYLRYEGGPSRRENLIKSFSKASGDIIAFMDADLSTDLKDLPALLELGDYDLGIGNRYLKGSDINRKSDRLFISWVFNSVLRVLFLSKLSDHYIGFKSFKRRVIIDLLKMTGVGVKDRGMFWDAEMLLWAQKKKFKIKNIPVKWVEGEKSALKMWKERSMIKYIAGLFFKYHRVKL